jgi:hypothetical protein
VVDTASASLKDALEPQVDGAHKQVDVIV